MDVIAIMGATTGFTVSGVFDRQGVELEIDLVTPRGERFACVHLNPTGLSIWERVLEVIGAVGVGVVRTAADDTNGRVCVGFVA